MGRVSQQIHETLENCDCYLEGADILEEMGLSTDSTMLIDFWNSLIDDDDKPKAYKSHNHNLFVRDTIKAGLEPYHYRGRFFYEGPAVNVEDLQTGIRASGVQVQWDNMGLRWVVYPC